jgi:hypothetical protein
LLIVNYVRTCTCGARKGCGQEKTNNSQALGEELKNLSTWYLWGKRDILIKKYGTLLAVSSALSHQQF